MMTSGVAAAQAQLYAPVMIAPSPQAVILPWGEHWREVSFKVEGGLSYQWGAYQIHVDPNGDQWVVGEKESRRAKLRFVEPFDAFGRRIPKAIADFPGAERRTSQRHYNPDGSWYGKSKLILETARGFQRGQLTATQPTSCGLKNCESRKRRPQFPLSQLRFQHPTRHFNQS